VIGKASALVATFVIASFMSGCAAPPMAAPYDPVIRQGVVEQVTEVALQGPDHVGVGAVVGGLSGLGLGSLIGGGGGRDVAMVLGAIGGGLIGDHVQQNNTPDMAGQEVIVRTNSGVLVTVVQPYVPGLFQGRTVYVEGGGQSARVIPRDY
jgi:outer membrane lipoprotein SlyB